MECVQARKEIDHFLNEWMQRIAPMNGLKTYEIVNYKLTGNETPEFYIIVESINRCSDKSIKFLQLDYMKNKPWVEIQKAFNKGRNATYKIRRVALFEFANHFYDVQKEMHSKNIIDFRHKYIE